jgi:hypothetical protein
MDLNGTREKGMKPAMHSDGKGERQQVHALV